MGLQVRRRNGKVELRDVNGILLLDKPVGVSSNTALQRCKRLFNARKAGHTGSLDVPACGLLPICFGEATKVSGYLLDAAKVYRTRFKLGERTSTGDAQGEIVATKPVPELTRQELESVMKGFIGEILQVPPMHSAIKHQGQPLYKLAYAGQTVERKARSVRIYQLDLLVAADQHIDLEVTCSKGTYIRTLAEDVGEVLGCGAHVDYLRRLAVGPFRIDGAVSLDGLCTLVEQEREALDTWLLAPDSALPEQPSVSLTADASYYLCQGQAVQVPKAPLTGIVRLYDPERRFLGVGQVLDDGRIAPRRLLKM